MSPVPTIRFVARADFSQWLPLWDGYNAFYGRSGTTALPGEITQGTWTRFFDAYEPVCAMVAEDEGQLVGFVHHIFHRSTISIAPTCYLQDLFTRESTRGKGIGRALINAVYEQARLAGVSRVYWQTHESNSTAMKLYDQVAQRPGSWSISPAASSVIRSTYVVSTRGCRKATVVQSDGVVVGELGPARRA